ncbi:MAG: hypothetical protein PHO32_07780, partial [Candidatus Cloacimonetes bacterium]|nr:hypothetical protein [Candidatus Cloacimonadota bacterium]
MKHGILVLFLLIVGLTCLYANTDKSFDYSKAWKEIDNTEMEKYPKTALEKIDSLYQASVKDQRSEDQIKALVYLMSLKTFLAEESDQIVFDLIDENIRGASFPASAILHSIRAEMYWSYYQSHYYTESQRSEVVNFTPGKIDTWDMKSLAKVAINEFRISLERSRELNAIPLTDYPVLCKNGDEFGMQARPTLYDLLAHRALQRYDANTSGFSVLFDNYPFDDASLLSNAQEFAQLQFTPADSTSGKYLTLRLYQDLISLHLKDKDAF